MGVWCPRCEEYRPFEEFFWNVDRRDGVRRPSAACRKHTAERLGEWRNANRERHRANDRRYQALFRKNYPELKAAYDRRSHLKSAFGLTEAQYAELLEAQDGGCAICGRAESVLRGRGHRADEPRELAVDHDPETKLVRGLLCFDCNTAIGKLLHDPALLIEAFVYLTGEPPESYLGL